VWQTMNNQVYLNLALSIGAVLALAVMQSPNQQTVRADCDLPGESHGDNSPSTKEGKEMIHEENASACEIAKACDSMEIDIKVDSDDLEEAHFYQVAHSELKEELEEVAEEGHGADGIECYELEYAVEEAS
jgi:hypothetical protein